MMGDIEEYPFSFINTPASLQIIASAEMALALWRFKFKNTHRSRNTTSSFLNHEFSCKEILVDPVAPRVEAKINEKIATIRLELKKWADFHTDQELFDGDFGKAFAKCLKHMVADAFGFISFKATAINIVNSSQFNCVENYKIATTFCLEDQVRRFWPLVRNCARIDVDFEDDECNLSYWNGCMKSAGDIKNDTLWVIRRMNVNAPNWKDDATAFEYFCKILPDHVRVWQIISCLERGYDRAVMRTLPTLRRAPAVEIFKQKTSSIFAILHKNGHRFQYAYQLRPLMEPVLENERTFVNVVRELWLMAFVPGGKHGSGTSYARCDQINRLLLEIWSNTPDKFKARISNTHIDDFFYQLATKTTKFSCHYGHDMTFVLDLLNRSQNLDKELFWQKNWRGLALLAKPSCFERLMKSCVPNDDGVEFIKNNLRVFVKLFRAFIKEGFYSDLKDYLDVFSKDARQVQLLSRKILASNLDVILSHNDDNFAKFDWFVGQVFSNVRKNADEFKTQIISSAECLECLFAARRRVDGIRSNDFGKIIGRFVTNEEKLQPVKRRLLEHCRTYPIDRRYKWDTFRTDQWQKFVEWCTIDDEEISAFKRSFDLDEIFSTHLNYYFELRYRWGDVLKSLDQFFNWYFPKQEDWRGFKLEKIRNYKQIDGLRSAMESKDRIGGGSDLYYLLKWGFDGDNEELREFCDSCNLEFFPK